MTKAELIDRLRQKRKDATSQAEGLEYEARQDPKVRSFHSYYVGKSAAYLECLQLLIGELN
jgi:hypothetical protein